MRQSYSLDNCVLFGTGENGVYLNRNARDTIKHCRNNGYTNTVYLSAIPLGLSGDVLLKEYNQTWIFGSLGSGTLKAPQGTKMFNHSQGKCWVQKSVDVNTPDWQPEVLGNDGGVKLVGLTVGGDGSTARNLMVNGSALISGGLTVGKADTVSFVSVGYAQGQTPAQNDKSKKLVNSEWFFNQFDKSITDNGWQKMPSGLIMQWGKVTGIAQGDGIKGTVSLPLHARILNVSIGILSAVDKDPFILISAVRDGQFDFTKGNAYNSNSDNIEFYWQALTYVA
ncbi:hypothetical protein NYR82_04205 [Actinobacillus equuli subsp. haemolyticus]|uniref:hypothetical protein n=1 Tax=Actinobacillus equuli TaxID=718 RepID=UPI002442BD66|nr:hypothetical protein [Actinobacillus equuli]WGE78050.1 hypothetical protein NYR82_04205 [Actinobacillus equuli subsp. haemolyticus]